MNVPSGSESPAPGGQEDAPLSLLSLARSVLAGRLGETEALDRARALDQPGVVARGEDRPPGDGPSGVDEPLPRAMESFLASPLVREILASCRAKSRTAEQALAEILVRSRDREVPKTTLPEPHGTDEPSSSIVLVGSSHAVSSEADAPAGSTSSTSRIPRRKIGNYDILCEIGRGGMGVVYLARQSGLDRLVALKVLPPGREDDRESTQRFLREARAAGRVRHDNLVAIHEVGTADDLPYYSMEYVPGPSIARLAKDGPIPPRRAARLVRDAARGLAAAHKAEIIHRDVKPSNVIVGPDDRARLVDFGLAKPMGRGGTLTASGTVLGTLVYMPPEQANPEDGHITPASDVYSLGATLYEALTGLPPFGPGENTFRLVGRILRGQFLPPRQIHAGVPRDLETIVLKAMEKNPARRYPEADGFAADLDRWLENRPILARPPGLARRTTLWARRRPAAAGAALLLVLAGLGLAASWGRARYHEALASREVEQGDERFDEGDYFGAIDRYDEALARAPGSEDAVRRRAHAVERIGGEIERALAAGRVAPAAELLDRLRTRLERPTHEESRILDDLARDLAEAKALAAARKRELEEDLAAAALAGPELLAATVARLAARVERLAEGASDPVWLADARSRIASAAERLVRLALVAEDLESLGRLERILAETAGPDRAVELSRVASELYVQARSDDGKGALSELPAVEIRTVRLRAGGWSGDQEAAVVARSAEAPDRSPASLEPGPYLVVVRADGHFPARFLLPVPVRARIDVRLRLYREQDYGLPVVPVARLEIACRDALEPPAPPDSPRGRLFSLFEGEFLRLSEQRDVFACLHELTNAEFLRIYPVPPRPRWVPSGWDGDAWTFPAGEEDRPVRGMTRHQARRIARDATQALLPAELREVWRYALPSNDPGDTGNIYRLSGEWTRVFPPEAAGTGDRSRWPKEALGNQGTGEVAAAGSFPADVSPDGCLDLAGNVSEWVDGAPEGALTHGGNFRFKPHENNDAGRISAGEVRDDVGVRLVLVPVTGLDPGEEDLPSTADAHEANRRALALYHGDAARGVEGDAYLARGVLERFLTRDPNAVSVRWNAALLALAEQQWRVAISHADIVVAQGDESAAHAGRFVRIWANLMEDRSGSGKVDAALAVADLDALLAARAENRVARFFRAYFLCLADRLPEGAKELDAVLPGFFRQARFERHLGFEELLDAQLDPDRKGAFRDLLIRRAALMFEMPRLGPDVLPADFEFLVSTAASGQAATREAADRWRALALRNLRADVLQELAGSLRREGETQAAALVRLPCLIARLFAIAGQKKEAELMLGISATLGRTAADAGPESVREGCKAEGELRLFWHELSLAAECLARAVETPDPDAATLLLFAWIRFDEGLASPPAERDRLFSGAREILARAAPHDPHESALQEALLLLEEGKLAEAEETLVPLSGVSPGDAAVWTYLGEIRSRRGDSTGADEAWTRAVASDRGYAPLVEALRRR